MTEYDVIVIGAGPVGENVADRTVQGGLSTVIVESELVGGECSYWACMPSKALLRSGAVLRAAADVDGAKQALIGGGDQPARVDAAGALRRRDAIVDDWNDDGQASWLESAHIDLVRGHGRLTGPKRVAVTSADGAITELTARHAVVVSTGSAAMLPDTPGLAGIRPWTSRDATSVHDVPDSLAIIGGGVVACEMASAFTDLGSRVTMIVRSRLLSNQEPFAADLVGTALTERGVTIHTGASVTHASRTVEGAASLVLGDGTVVTTSEVLVATGRAPRTADLGLESVQLEPGAWLDVDDTLRVSGTDWLYAVGDVNHRALMTHQGKYQGRAAGDVIAARAAGGAVDDSPWGAHVATADHCAVPQVVFSDPEVASVGLTAAAAARAGTSVRVRDYDLSGVSGASEAADHYRGQARLVIDDARDVIVGATFAGPDVAELLHAATIAIVGEVPLARLWHAVPAYPTISEVWLRLLEADGRETALSGRSAARA